MDKLALQQRCRDSLKPVDPPVIVVGIQGTEIFVACRTEGHAEQVFGLLNKLLDRDYINYRGEYHEKGEIESWWPK